MMDEQSIVLPAPGIPSSHSRLAGVVNHVLKSALSYNQLPVDSTLRFEIAESK